MEAIVSPTKKQICKRKKRSRKRAGQLQTTPSVPTLSRSTIPWLEVDTASEDDSGFPFDLKPEWLFLDINDIWRGYGTVQEAGDLFLRNTDSESLERDFQGNNDGSLYASSVSHSYNLDFKRMVQKNTVTGTERRIWRKTYIPCCLPKFEWHYQNEHQAWCKIILDDQIDIEKEYSIVPKLKYAFKYKGRMVTINFMEMLLTDDEIQVSVPLRRTLSVFTFNSDKNRSTEFLWMSALNEGTWYHIKEEKSVFGNYDQFKSKLNISTDAIENAFNKHHSGKVDIRQNNVTYIVNFNCMTIEDISAGEIHQLRCVKEYKESQIAKYGYQLPGFSIPNYWSPMPDSVDTFYVALNENCDEFVFSLKMLQKELPNYFIVRMERIQNLFHMKNYENKTKYIRKKYPDKDLDEQLLFHGTKKKNLRDICEQNLDWRLYGRM